MAARQDLRSNTLSGLETFGQSIASIAPTAAPAMIISQVFALSGNGTWLAYLIATVGLALVAANINVFARRSASPGSLYSFIAAVLPPLPSVVAAWSLVIAYICTAIALTGGLTSYVNVFLTSLRFAPVSPALLTVIAVLAAGALAYRDVALSARLMLALEGFAVLLIAFLVGSVLYLHGLHLDTAQLRLTGVTSSSLRLGLVLAVFSSVGFESATALGAEARNPLCSIPRAVFFTAICSELFFTLCSYAEVLGFRERTESLATSQAPLHVLALGAGLPILGVLMDVSAVVSFFSCTLACLTAAARVLFHMARENDLPAAFGEAHSSNQTPHCAVVLATAVSIVAGVVLAVRGVPGFDINGWLGTVATFGFLTAYILVCLAAPLYLHAHGQLTLPAILLAGSGVAVMGLVFAGSLYPVPAAPLSYLPPCFLVLLAAGVAYSFHVRASFVRRSEAELATYAAAGS